MVLAEAIAAKLSRVEEGGEGVIVHVETLVVESLEHFAEDVGFKGVLGVKS